MLCTPSFNRKVLIGEDYLEILLPVFIEGIVLVDNVFRDFISIFVS